MMLSAYAEAGLCVIAALHRKADEIATEGEPGMG